MGKTFKSSNLRIAVFGPPKPKLNFRCEVRFAKIRAYQELAPEWSKYENRFLLSSIHRRLFCDGIFQGKCAAQCVCQRINY